MPPRGYSLVHWTPPKTRRRRAGGAEPQGCCAKDSPRAGTRRRSSGAMEWIEIEGRRGAIISEETTLDQACGGDQPEEAASTHPGRIVL